VGGFIQNPAGDVLMVRRAHEPARGKLAIPGGFIDINETAEEALRRETREEVGLELSELTYLSSQVNSYRYEEVTYPVLDFFFVANAVAPEKAQLLDGVDALRWMAPAKVDLAEIAFPSIRRALSQWNQR
jgi:ADP-ribose pyrophosphatase YjhB (NUDIX family)